MFTNKKTRLYSYNTQWNKYKLVGMCLKKKKEKKTS